MLYDIFLFNNEYQLLELRMKENWNVFDKFVLIQGDKTFQGNKKLKLFGSNYDKKKFSWALEKLEIHNVLLKLKGDPEYKSAWHNENLQINYAEKYLKSKNFHDYFFFGAVDEIPNKKVISETIVNYYAPSTFEQDFFYYAYNNKIINHMWSGTILLKKENLLNNSLLNIVKDRYMNLPRIKNGGWHFSFLGDSNTIINKIKSFSHQEYNNNYFLNEQEIKKKIDNSIDIFERRKGDPNLGGGDPFVMKRVFIDSSFPEYLKNNKKKYSNNIFTISDYL